MNYSVDNTLPGKFDISSIRGGFRIIFYCNAGDKKYTKEIYNSHSVDHAINIAWQESKVFFNRCHQCGAWVCDEHYNEDVMKCITCKPK